MSGPSKPNFVLGLITRVFGLPRIDPLDEVTGLPPRPAKFPQNLTLW